VRRSRRLQSASAKNLNVWAGGGGVTTRSDELARKLRLYRKHGLVNRDEIEFFGINCRFDTMQAVVANRLFPQLDFITQTRIKNAAIYDAAWKDITDCVAPSGPSPRREARVSFVHSACERSRRAAGLFAAARR
jgi:dTDP-4-amino-4,6-dideoxygalactose transaminase